MKIPLFLVSAGLTVVFAAKFKREAYELPAAAEQLVGTVRTTFVCSNDGYYADQDNSCQIFHVCHTVISQDGTSKMLQWSFICGNNTIFNQFSFTCSLPEEAVPCGRAKDFWYLNNNIGVGSDVPFHKYQDVSRTVVVNTGHAAHPLKIQPYQGHLKPTPRHPPVVIAPSMPPRSPVRQQGPDPPKTSHVSHAVPRPPPPKNFQVSGWTNKN